MSQVIHIKQYLKRKKADNTEGKPLTIFFNRFTLGAKIFLLSPILITFLTAYELSKQL